MELDEFVGETLKQIVKGEKDAQDSEHRKGQRGFCSWYIMGTVHQLEYSRSFPVQNFGRPLRRARWHCKGTLRLPSTRTRSGPGG